MKRLPSWLLGELSRKLTCTDTASRIKNISVPPSVYPPPLSFFSTFSAAAGIFHVQLQANNNCRSYSKDLLTCKQTKRMGIHVQEG